MNRLLLTVTVIVLLAGAFATVPAEDDKPWFDMENCAFCKQITAQEGLADHMHHEYHHIKDGYLQVTKIDEGYREAYVKAQHAMQEVAEEMGKTGEFPYMCQHCSMYGQFMMAGVKTEHVESGCGDIFLMTSGDPEMVPKLHDFADRSREGMASHDASEE